MEPSGSRPSRTFSCTSTFSGACSGARCWACSPRRTRTAACSSSATSRRSRTRKHSRGSLRLCAGSSGSSTARSRSPDPKPCCAISRATRTASPSRTAGLIAADDGGVSFRWKDYRIDGPERWKTMTLGAHEFISRFLLHVLPKGFHRIRHYGLFANSNRTESIARARELLAVAPKPEPRQGRCRRAARVADAVSMLRRTHERHRGVRARHPTKASADTDACRDQDRYVMKKRNRPTCSSVDRRRWSCTGNDPSCPTEPDRHAKRPSDPLAMPLRRRRRLLLDRRHCPNNHARRPSISPRPRRPASIPIEPAAPLVLHLPRLRALALLRRRPSARAESPTSRRPRNLHKCGHRDLVDPWRRAR